MDFMNEKLILDIDLYNKACTIAYLHTVSPIPNGTKFRCTTNHSPALVVISNHRAGLKKVCSTRDGADCMLRLFKEK